eukprot:7463179-Alexandrium_andersonii.AAC.1
MLQRIKVLARRVLEAPDDIAPPARPVGGGQADQDLRVLREADPVVPVPPGRPAICRARPGGRRETGRRARGGVAPRLFA